MNPELRRGITPPNSKNYKIRIPVGYTNKFIASYDQIPSEKTTSWAKHKIRRGETVSSIARKYGISQSAIVTANKLGRKKRIYAGKTLMIPLPSGSSYASSSGSKSSGSKVVPSNNGTYRVRRGDTLWEIAEAHGVSVRQLKSANRLSSNKIYVGRKLKIPGKGTSSSKSTTTSGKYVKYTVRKGDNLWKIAGRFGTSIANLKKVNGLTSNSIYPGTSLMVPDNGSSTARSGSGEFSWYTIRKGDSLWKIAKKYNTSVKQLAEWNNIRSNSRLYPGRKLKIY